VNQIFGSLHGNHGVLHDRLELHHLWNPDWTYSLPQRKGGQVITMDGQALCRLWKEVVLGG
jgi:hypothetical protein